ncbi:MAG TPA: formylglycine-generating enzyme family protein [Polyangia bacterium]
MGAPRVLAFALLPAVASPLATGLALGDERPPARVADRAGLTLVPVASGEFLMGTSDEQADLLRAPFWRSAPIARDDDMGLEMPRHRVKVSKGFYISAHEVTVAQFRRFVAATGYVTDAEKNGHGRGFDRTGHDDDDGDGGPGAGAHRKRSAGRFETAARYTWKNPGFPQGDNHPVVLVSWNDAAQFCAWLSREEHATYRLPTEAEWEYAARAGTEGWLSFGDDPTVAHRFANLADTSLEKAHPGHVARQRLVDLDKDPSDGFVYTAPVGTFKPNAFGLFDVHGNVWEWCLDRYGATFYRQLQDPAVDPKGPSTPDGNGDFRVVRGGSFYTDVIVARSSSRLWAAPADAFCYTGFRVVRER